MNRRDLLRGVGASLILGLMTAPVWAQPVQRPNGRWTGWRLSWSNAGGDPYTGTDSHAINLLGLSEHKERIVRRLEQAPDEIAEIVEGQYFDAMVSGGSRGPAWVAQPVVAYPSHWRAGTSRQIKVWYFWDIGITLLRAEACNNLILLRVGTTTFIQCRCEPARGDLCPSGRR